MTNSQKLLYLLTGENGVREFCWSQLKLCEMNHCIPQMLNPKTQHSAWLLFPSLQTSSLWESLHWSISRMCWILPSPFPSSLLPQILSTIFFLNMATISQVTPLSTRLPLYYLLHVWGSAIFLAHIRLLTSQWLPVLSRKKAKKTSRFVNMVFGSSDISDLVSQFCFSRQHSHTDFLLPTSHLMTFVLALPSIWNASAPDCHSQFSAHISHLVNTGIKWQWAPCPAVRPSSQCPVLWNESILSSTCGQKEMNI